MKAFPKLTVVDNPISGSYMAAIRDKSTPPSEFRRLTEAISHLLGYEALKEFTPYQEVDVETPLEVTQEKVIVQENIYIMPILRAGLSFSNGLSKLLPGAKVIHIGLKRNEKSLKPESYYSSIPSSFKGEERVVVVDPMVATAGSLKAACQALLQSGLSQQQICCVALLAAPEGLAAFFADYPDIKLVVAAVDKQLNEKGFIVPGLGDAGDRCYGTFFEH